MKRILTMLLCLTGCAYGVAPDQEPTYGHSQGPQSDSDAGISSWGGDNPNGGVPAGCYVETIKVEGQLPMFFTFCPSDPGLSYKWLVDPPPDGTHNLPIH